MQPTTLVARGRKNLSTALDCADKPIVLSLVTEIIHSPLESVILLHFVLDVLRQDAPKAR